jgi:TetR/AcrR family transcriptional repressor of uid operon
MRRVQPPAVRRAQIVDAAKRRFREGGFHATTMADIAAQAGVSVGLLYRYFPSKEEIIRAITEADLLAQLAAIETPLASHPDDDAAALDALIASLATFVADRDRTLLQLETIAEQARGPALAQSAFEIERRAKTLIEDRFGAGLPQQERESRIRMVLHLFTALGFEVFRDPSRAELATRLTAQAVRDVLNRRTGPT